MLRFLLIDYLTWTKQEKRGIIVLIILIVGLAIAPFLIREYYPSPVYDLTAHEKEIDEFLSGLIPLEEEPYQNRLDKYIDARYDTLDLFRFNPNTISAENWIKLGLTEKQIRTIQNYLTKGGRFYDKEDFRKIYGIRTRQFQHLKPYIDLPAESQYAQEYKNNYPEKKQIQYFEFDPNTVTHEQLMLLGFSDKQSSAICSYREQGARFREKADFKKVYVVSETKYNELESFIAIEEIILAPIVVEVFVVELNSCTKEDLVKIKGIGNYTAQTIIDYRTKLGGYQKVSQVLEIKGFRSENYEKIQTSLVANSKLIKPIRINFAEFKELLKHPYLNYEDTKAILNYRNKHGSYTNLEVLKIKELVTETVFQKIKPYLTIQ